MRIFFCLSVAMTSTLLVTAQPPSDAGVIPSSSTTSGPLPAQSNPLPDPSVMLPPQPVPLTEMQLAVVTMLAGQYSNLAQYNDDIEKNVSIPDRHNFIESFYIPVVCNILGPVPTLYHEQRVNNESAPARQVLLVFIPLSPCLLSMQTIEIANASRISATPEGFKLIENLQRSDIAYRQECDQLFEQSGPESYVSYMSTDQCILEGPEGQTIRPDVSRNLTCSGLSVNELWRRVPGGNIIGGARSPYILEKTGNQYPVPINVFNANKCFAIPCTNNGNTQTKGPAWSEIKSYMSYNKKDGNQNNNAQ